MRYFLHLGLVGTLGVLAACQADSSDAASQPAIDPAFQSACAKQITAQMIDPTAAEISYSNMTTEDGIKASVTVTNPTDGSISALEFLCIPNGDGDAIAELLAD